MFGGALMFVLLSGCVLLAARHSAAARRFHAVRLKKTWAEAQRYCRDEFTDLATIRGPAQGAAARRAAGSGRFWIGLFRGSWTWSEGNQDASLTFSNWTHGEPLGACVTVSEDGSWSTAGCSAQHLPLCSTAEPTVPILVPQAMSWSRAQSYCRSKYSDLSGVRSPEDNHLVSRLLANSQEGPPPSRQRRDESEETSKETPDGTPDGTGRHAARAWIGLHRSSWRWSDGVSAPFRPWAEQQSGDVSADCVAADSGVWHQERCEQKHFFLCFTEGRRALVKVRLRGGTADLNDPTLQDAVLLQLRRRLEEAGLRQEVKLRWRKQPDGKVFHRETAPPAAPEEPSVCNGVI